MRSIIRGRGLGAFVCALGITFAACSSEEENICDAATLRDALDRAGVGETIRVGMCEVSGSFTIPAGVTLVGAGQRETSLRFSGEEPLLTMMPGSSATTLSDVRLESHTSHAVHSTGEGSIRIERVDVAATLGVAVEIENVTRLAVEDVSIVGPVSEENVRDLPANPEADQIAIFGLRATGTESVELRAVTARGFARGGVALIDSEVSWEGGGSEENAVSNLMVQGGAVSLSSLELSNALRNGWILSVSSVVLLDGATVETTDLQVADNGGIGVLHDHVSASHAGLVVTGSEDGGVWAQWCPSLEVSGSEITDNVLVGIYAVETESFMVEETRIAGTSSATITREEEGDIVMHEVGDGIHIVAPTGPVALRDVVLEENERIDVLVDVGDGDVDDVVIEDVEVDGETDGSGIVVQGDDTPEDERMATIGRPE